jgi:2'-5' RNA ligase
MNGIASLLNDPYKSQIEAIWQELEQKCGLIGVRVTPLPHFTYQVVEAYDQPRLVRILEELARQTRPFKVHTTGVGLFTGEMPVIYLPLVKNDALLHFHKIIWDRTIDTAQGPSPYYSPDSWIPHITLGYGDVTNFNLGCAMEALAFKDFNWEITVDNLTFIGQFDQNLSANGNCCTFHFGE